MNIESIIINNFRQFRGKQKLDFASGGQKNITLIHAENGFGKTTILNALLWALYGHSGLTNDFEGKQKIISHSLVYDDSIDEKEKFAEIVLNFKHDEEEFRLTRRLTLKQQRLDPKKETLNLQWNIDGIQVSVKNPTKKIRSIIPPGVSKYLFFNGERINELGLDENRSGLKDAIEQMLGLKILADTIEDLSSESILADIRKDLVRFSNDENKATIKNQIRLEEEIGRFEKEKNDKFIEGEKCKQTINTIDEKLKDFAATKQNVEERAKLTKERNDHDLAYTKSNEELGHFLRDEAFMFFVPDLLKKSKKIIQGLKERNVFPVPVSVNFLDELLERRICVCGNPLKDGSKEFKNIQSKKKSIPDQGFHEAVNSVEATITRIDEKITSGSTKKTYKRICSALSLASEKRSNCEEEIERLLKEIGVGNKESVINELNINLTTHQKSEKAIHQRIGALTQLINDTKKQKSVVDAEVSKLGLREEKYLKAKNKSDLVNESVEVLKKILEVETKELSEILNREINKNFSQIIDRDYKAVLTEGFELNIIQNYGDVEVEVAKSTGQRQVMLLAFVASLVELASKRGELDTILKNLTGNIYPIVVDAPFGNISQFRKKICSWIPKLAPQLTMFLTSTQYEGAAAEALKENDRIGKRYYLKHKGPLRQDKDWNSEIEIDGEKYTHYEESDEETTEIVEMS